MANLSALVKHDELEGPIVYIILQKSTLEELEEIHNVDTADRRVLIIQHLLFDELPEDKIKARKTKAQAARFFLIEGELFNRSIEGPYMKFLGPAELLKVLEELHEGNTGNHFSGRSLTFQTHRVGYCWPKMKLDVVDLVKKCDKCQKYAGIFNMHAPE